MVTAAARKYASVMLSCFLLTTACGGKAAAPRSTKAPLTRVTLNVNPTFTYAAIAIAREEGFFAAEGIDAEFVSLDPNSAVAAAATGKLDVLCAGVRSGVFNMIAKGAPMRVVAGKGQSSKACVQEAFIAPAATAARIAAKGGSLKGEKLAIMRGGMNEQLFDQLLDYTKTARADVEVVQMPQGSAASTRDRIDAVRYANEPDLSNSLADGWARVVVSTEAVAPGHQSAMMVFSKRLLDDHQLGVRFMRAYLRGVRQYQQGKTPRNVEIVSRFTKVPPEILHRACWSALSADGQLNIASVQGFLSWAKARHYLDGDAPVAQWWDPSYINAARTSATQ